MWFITSIKEPRFKNDLSVPISRGMHQRLVLRTAATQSDLLNRTLGSHTTFLATDCTHLDQPHVKS
jgi:hypothetical protein